MNEDLFAAAENAIAGSLATQDPDYPLFHVAPPVGRLNDPNGLVLRDGRYHAFYQFSPFHPHRKLVYWGHASSDDLTHWRDDGPAIVPDSRYDADGAYSGSAVLDGPDVRFYYTGNLRHPDGGRDTSQCLVTSTDLERFDKHPGNPLIPMPPPGYTAHVRDPQVWRDADGSYRMCLGAQRANETGCALLYRSNDGIQWWFEGELSFPDAQGAFDAFGYMWECPSLIRVPDEASGEWRDVLVFCPQGIAPLGEGFENVFPCGSVIGRLVGTELRDTGPFVELDRGFEFYAPQVVARQDADREPPLLLAWLGNAGEDDQPSLAHGWVHTLSVPRELTVRDGRLVQRPRLECPARTSMQINGRQLRNQRVELVEARGVRSFALGLCLDVTEAQSWSLRLGTEDCHIDLAVAKGLLVVDRSTTRYPRGGRRTVTLPDTPTIEVDLYFDRSVLEVFFGKGSLSFSLRAYLSEAPFVVQLTAAGAVGVMSATISPFE